MKIIFAFLIILTTFSTYAQTVSGFVVDQENQPVIGAKVMEVGSRNGTTTNIDGSFILTLNEPNASLIFSFYGFETDSVLLQHNQISQVVLKKATGNKYIGGIDNYIVIFILIWFVVSAWFAVRAFRGVSSA
ncbi:MAG: hypothetical protein ACJA08_000232 [Cyclobacteriaceae bacterium]|jgi:hypothetical protein